MKKLGGICAAACVAFGIEASVAQAATVGQDGLIKYVTAYADGTGGITFTPPGGGTTPSSSCGTSPVGYYATLKMPSDKFVASVLLTAYTTGKTVRLGLESTNCTIVYVTVNPT